MRPQSLPGQLASRDECLAVREDLLARCEAKGIPLEDIKLAPGSPLVGGPITIRPGSLRFNIVQHIQASSTIRQALYGFVYGAEGTKHSPSGGDPYKIKFVDIGFSIANGFSSASI